MAFCTFALDNIKSIGYKMNTLRILLLTLLLPISLLAQNNTYSYIYIEGDKETSFYVKLEGKMMPRLGQHYSILPNLDAGVTNIEILFQQNKYPAQQFKINVPKNGTRSLLIRKVTDNQFALYDLTNNYLIPSGNRAEDDKYTSPQVENNEDIIDDNEIASNTNNKSENENIPEFNPPKKEIEKTEKEAKVVKENEVTKKEKEPKVKKEKEPKEPKEKKEFHIIKPKEKQEDAIIAPNTNDSFIENIVFDPIQEKTNTPVSTIGEKNNTSTQTQRVNCNEPMSNVAFEDFALAYLEKRDDNAKIKLLKKNSTKCFSAEQVRIIATNLESTSARFETVTLLYPQTIDKSQYYEKLESLFRTQFFKDKLKELAVE